jgi:hypothetical protein
MGVMKTLLLRMGSFESEEATTVPAPSAPKTLPNPIPGYNPFLIQTYVKVIR